MKQTNKKAEVKTEDKKPSQYIVIGESLANDLLKAENELSNSKRKIIFDVAIKYYSDSVATSVILDSYAKQIEHLGMSNNIARVRKAEANTIFKALSKTEITKENESILLNFDGSYNAWIDKARNLVKSSEVTEVKKTSNRVPKVTEKQEADILDKMKSATVIQLSDFIAEASENLNVQRSKEEAHLAEYQQLLLLSSIANNMLNNKQFEATTKEVAKQVIALVTPQIDKLRINEANAINAIKEVMKAEAIV